METRTKVKKSLWNFIDSKLSYLVGETEVGDKDPHREEWRIILPTAELRFDWFLYGDKCVDLGLGRSFCMVRSLTVSALPVGGKVQWILLTHPGGALCLTSDKGTNVFKTKFSSMMSFFSLVSSLKIPNKGGTSHLDKDANIKRHSRHFEILLYHGMYYSVERNFSLMIFTKKEKFSTFLRQMKANFK